MSLDLTKIDERLTKVEGAVGKIEASVGTIVDAVREIKGEHKEQSQFPWKVLGGAVTVLGLCGYAAVYALNRPGEIVNERQDGTDTAIRDELRYLRDRMDDSVRREIENAHTIGKLESGREKK